MDMMDGSPHGPRCDGPRELAYNDCQQFFSVVLLENESKPYSNHQQHRWRYTRGIQEHSKPPRMDGDTMFQKRRPENYSWSNNIVQDGL
jgi:hypothetical protein